MLSKPEQLYIATDQAFDASFHYLLYTQPKLQYNV